MSTEDMATTNQGSDYKTLADKIPSTVAEGFQKVAEKTVNAATSAVKKAATSGMSAG